MRPDDAEWGTLCVFMICAAAGLALAPGRSDTVGPVPHVGGCLILRVWAQAGLHREMLNQLKAGCPQRDEAGQDRVGSEPMVCGICSQPPALELGSLLPDIAEFTPPPNFLLSLRVPAPVLASPVLW